MQGGRGVKIVIFMALRCKVMENTRKTAGAWGKSFSGPLAAPKNKGLTNSARGSPTTGFTSFFELLKIMMAGNFFIDRIGIENNKMNRIVSICGNHDG